MSNDQKKNAEEKFLNYAKGKPLNSENPESKDADLIFTDQDLLIAERYGGFVWVLLVALPAFLVLILILERKACSATDICMTNISNSFIQGSLIILLLLLVFQILERCCTRKNVLLALVFKKRYLDIPKRSDKAKSEEAAS